MELIVHEKLTGANIGILLCGSILIRLRGSIPLKCTPNLDIKNIIESEITMTEKKKIIAEYINENCYVAKSKDINSKTILSGMIMG